MKAMLNKPIPGRFLARIRTLILAALSVFLCVGCQDVVSTSPLAGEGQAIFDDRLLGTWVEPPDPDDPKEPENADDPADQTVVERDADNGYRITSFENDEKQVLTVQLTQIGGHRFLQYAHDCSEHLFFEPENGEQCYFFVKAEIEDNSLSLAFLDYERVFQDSLARKLSVEHEIVERWTRTAPARHASF